MADDGGDITVPKFLLLDVSLVSPISLAILASLGMLLL
jgi:hypothetical protein